MRVWLRTKDRLKCGYDQDCYIPEQEVYCLITAAGQAWKKIRCAAHAGDPPARDVVPQFKPAPSGPLGFSRVGSLARTVPQLRIVAERFDFKRAAAGGDREE